MLDTILGETPALRRMQAGVARAVLSLGLTANAATLLGLGFGIAAGAAFLIRRIVFGIALLAVSAGFDAIDGTIARNSATAPTPYGGVLDLVSDRVVEVAVIVGIAWNRPELYFPAFLLVASWYVNITVFLAVGAAIERRGPKLIDYPPGLLERTEALIFFAVLAAIAANGPVLCYLFTALEVITGAQRFLFGRNALR